MAEQGQLSGQKAGGDKYLLGELLGEGGFGAVYKAQHLHLQRSQAIKVLHEQHLRNPAFRDRFRREAQTLASLDNPYIVHIDDFWVEPSRAYLVMPFIQGGTLQDILRKQQTPLALDRIASYLEHISTALDYAHQRGVVHLDLKPLNLLIHDDGRLLLSDFGLAHLMKQGIVDGGSSLKLGTPHYMAPEHIQGKPEKRSDVYALGVILYEMLAGHRPFEGAIPEVLIYQHFMKTPPPLDTSRPGVNRVVERALAKQPEQRYQTCGELFGAFKQAIVTPTHQKLATTQPPQPAQKPAIQEQRPAYPQPQQPRVLPKQPSFLTAQPQQLGMSHKLPMTNVTGTYNFLNGSVQPSAPSSSKSSMQLQSTVQPKQERQNKLQLDPDIIILVVIGILVLIGAVAGGVADVLENGVIGDAAWIIFGGVIIGAGIAGILAGISSSQIDDKIMRAGIIVSAIVAGMTGAISGCLVSGGYIPLGIIYGIIYALFVPISYIIDFFPNSEG